MALIKNIRSGEKITLQVQHTFGRQSETCTTVLTHSQMSRLHAVISWDGESWTLKDSSSNGTYVNGCKQKAGENLSLHKHDKIQFGSLQADHWEVISLVPPQSMLIPVSPNVAHIELNDIAALPSDDSPEVTIYLNEDGQWVCESPSGTALLQSGDLVGTPTHTWRFIDSKPALKTSANEDSPPPPPNKIQYEFDVSQNEEHVSIKLVIDNKSTDLGERSHHYLLLILARQRLQDKAKGIKEKEQGWIEKSLLTKMLHLEEAHINIQIYRFRKQLIAAHPNTLILHKAIERRTGELRFACGDIIIRGGIAMQTQILPSNRARKSNGQV